MFYSRNLTVKQFALHLVMASLTFLIGVTVASVFTRHNGHTNQASGPLIRIKSTLALCELMEDPQRYEFKSIRIAARLVGAHEMAFYDPACNSIYVRADFASRSREKFTEGMRALGISSLERGSLWTEVLVSGHLQKVPKGVLSQQDGGGRTVEYEYGFVVSDVKGMRAVTSIECWVNGTKLSPDDCSRRTLVSDIKADFPESR